MANGYGSSSSSSQRQERRRARPVVRREPEQVEVRDEQVPTPLPSTTVSAREKKVKNIQKVKGNQEAIMFSLGLLTRGRSDSMLSDKDKELRDNMLEEIKRLSKLLTEMAKEGMQMIEDATAFATTDEGTDFINRNI